MTPQIRTGALGTLAAVALLGSNLGPRAFRAQAQTAPTPAPTPPATLLVFDDFSSAARGSLPPSSSNPAIRQRYVNGEYEIALIDPTITGAVPVTIPGVVPDSTISVDARVVGDPTNQQVGLFCRRDTGPRGYRFDVLPGAGTFGLERVDKGVLLPLVASARAPSLVTGAQINHLALTCAGSTISASINGIQVASAQDATYQSGQNALLAGTVAAGGGGDALYAKLFVVSAGPSPASGTDTAAVAPPSGTTLASDNFSDPAHGLLPTWGYLNGEFQIPSTSSLSVAPGVLVAGDYRDVSVAVDARIASTTSPNAGPTISCRRWPTSSGTGITGYELIFLPTSGAFELLRLDSDNFSVLAGPDYAPGDPSGDSTHHLALTCAGTTISASIDGSQLASSQDSTYRHGNTGLGVSGLANAAPGTIDVRFANLTLSQP